MEGYKPGTQKIFALVGSIVGWFAVIAQLYLMLVNRSVSLAECVTRFFSFFTILTNILVALCFSKIAFAKTRQHSFFIKPSTLYAVTVYILVVGIVYNIILRFTWNPQGLQKIVDELLHTIQPLYFVLFWWVFVRRNVFSWKIVFVWLLYPLVYLSFILLRGAVSGFYPYPFVNVTELGYAKVALNAGILLMAFLVLSSLFVAIGRFSDLAVNNPKQV